MSSTAVHWAMYRARTSEAAHKLVLMALANHADKHGRGAYPSAGTIAEAMQLSVRTVQRYLVALEEDGLIVRGDQARAAHIPPRHRPIVYDLAIRQGDVSPGGSDTSPGADPIRQRTRSDTSPVSYKPKTNQELNPRAESSPGLPPSPTALRAAELAACEHGAPPGRCALCRRAGHDD